MTAMMPKPNRRPVNLPPKLVPVFTGDARYRGAYGGRGSAKTRTFAKMTAVWGYRMAEAGQRGMILCFREYMNSLAESSMEEVKMAIREEPWLDDYYEIGDHFIRTKNRRIWYGFAGLRHNLDSIKSKSRILLAWGDEAENISEIGWQKLIPTVRDENSEVWVTWNPEVDGSPTDKRFRKNPPARSKIVEMNHQDNPWFTKVLEEERQNDRKRLDDATYAWIWDGAYRENSEAQILGGKYIIEEFEPQPGWDGPYDGLDFGFAQDPTAAVRVWINGDTLLVEREAGKTGLELDHTADYMAKRIPGFCTNTVRADSARPESISFLKRHGFPKIIPVDKWPGSVEDGIAHLRSYRQIIIHPRCTETIKEARLYSYKIDRLTGDVLPIVVDEHNHYIDAIRYALGAMIKRKGASFFAR